MNDIKKVGRPKSFDRDDALKEAVNVFWKLGYEGASIKMLTDSMGINSPSLYAEFGDKHGLYLAAINSYVSNDACGPLAALELEPDIRDAVTAFFHAAIDYGTHHAGGSTGCFLSSCVATSAGHVDGTAELLREAIETTTARIEARFLKEIERGTLPKNFRCKDRAKLLFDLRQGMAFRARAGVADQCLRGDIAEYVSATLGETQS